MTKSKQCPVKKTKKAGTNHKRESEKFVPMSIIQDEEEEVASLPPLPKERVANHLAITLFITRTSTKPKEISQKMAIAGGEDNYKNKITM